MRIRSVKPDFWRDELTGLMDPSVGLFYLGLACYADDEGRFEWNAALIRADLDPYDAKWGGTSGIGKHLENLRRLKRIVRYVVGGRTYGFIPTQTKHQKPNRPTESKFPPPPDLLTEDSVSPPGSLTAGEGVGEGEGEGTGEHPAAAPPPLRLAPESLDLGIPAAPPPTPKAAAERVSPSASVVALKRAASDERFGPWIGTLKRVFSEARGADLAVNGRDGKRLKEFLAANPRATEAEAEARWRRALSLGAKWPGCATVAHFCDRWNELAGDAPAQPKVTAAAAQHGAFAGKEVPL
jgi:hypothetical protein